MRELIKEDGNEEFEKEIEMVKMISHNILSEFHKKKIPFSIGLSSLSSLIIVQMALSDVGENGFEEYIDNLRKNFKETVLQLYELKKNL